MILGYETATRIAKSHQCVTCREKSRLAVRWWRADWDLYCPVCGNTASFTRIPTLTQEWRRDPGSVPLTIANRLAQRYGGEPMSSTALTKLTEPQMLERMNGAAVRWITDLNPLQRRTLAQAGVAYGLDPIMGEVTIYEGNLYITRTGHLRKANEHPAFEGIEVRPMTNGEKEQYGLTEEPYAWIAKVYKRGMRVPAVGIGTANPKRPFRSKQEGDRWVGGNPVERVRPWLMAEARAVRKALATYFPHGLPLAAAEDAGIILEGGAMHRTEIEPAAPYALRPGDTDTVEEDDLPDFAAESAQFDEVQHIEANPAAPEPPKNPEEARRRVIALAESLGRCVDSKFLVYFKTHQGVEWTSATAQHLDAFAHHLADLIVQKQAKESSGGKA